MKSKYYFLVLCVFASIAKGQGLANHYEIDYVRVDRNGKGYVKFMSDLVGSPAACTAAGYKRTLSFNVSTEGGKAIMSLALAAKASGLKIKAYGTGSCGEYGNVMESWNWGYVH